MLEPHADAWASTRAFARDQMRGACQSLLLHTAMMNRSPYPRSADWILPSTVCASPNDTETAPSASDASGPHCQLPDRAGVSTARHSSGDEGARIRRLTWKVGRDRAPRRGAPYLRCNGNSRRRALARCRSPPADALLVSALRRKGARSHAARLDIIANRQSEPNSPTALRATTHSTRMSRALRGLCAGVPATGRSADPRSATLRTARYRRSDLAQASRGASPPQMEMLACPAPTRPP